MSEVLKNVIEMFKVVPRAWMPFAASVETSYLSDGFVTNFDPTPVELAALKEIFKPLPLTTLFTVEERANAPIEHLLAKQFLHYLEVYGLDSPGLFNLEVNTGKIATVAFVKAISVEDFSDMIREILYSNAPVKDSKIFKQIVDHYEIKVDVNQVKNNEMRVLLFDESKDSFEDGDDAVRYIVYRATNSAMLIKSKDVLSQIKNLYKSGVSAKASSYFGTPTATGMQVSKKFLEDHLVTLAMVFRRHKNILLSMKNPSNASTINRIARLAKKYHRPWVEPAGKTFVADRLAGKLVDPSVLSIRDKFKILNAISYKASMPSHDIFNIRNGKIFIKPLNKEINYADLYEVRKSVLQSLADDLKYLHNKKILLDGSVDYGLPISRKQTLGNLPFYTKIEVSGNEISSGIYWHNDGGARDIDLSAIDQAGNRTGWGGYSGYNDNPIVYSGDLTTAPNGAMEFMTSKKTYAKAYAISANIFNGNDNSDVELVVGNKSKNHWIGNTVIREKFKLKRGGSVLGFVKNGKFIVFNGKVTSKIVSNSGQTPAIAKALAPTWTVRTLLDMVGIPYDTTLDSNTDIAYDHNLTYEGFTFDKLEKLFEFN